MAQVAYKYTWTLPRLHGLDNYSLGMNLNWHGHKSGLDKISCSINFAHFSGVKNHFLFSYISHMIWFYILELFSVPKKHLICELFSSSLPPSSTQKCCFMGSVASGQQRPSYAPLITDTQWGGATLLTAQMQMFHASRKLYSADIFYMIFYAPILLLCSKGQFAWWWQICLNIKMHWRSHVLPILGKLYHTLSSARYLCVCNGLTPFYGYASRTFFTRKKGLGMLHVIFHGNSATYHCWIASIGFLLLLWFISHKRGRLIACSHSNTDGNGRL